MSVVEMNAPNADTNLICQVGNILYRCFCAAGVEGGIIYLAVAQDLILG